MIAHEYGHHIAHHRSNAPLSAIDFGPKRWSSYELVCDKTSDGKLAPGDEGDDYAYNPGEAWAETYARLVFPEQAWRLAPLLQPTSGSYLAAAADVLQPWTQRVEQDVQRRRARRRSSCRSRSTARSRCSSSRTPKEMVIRSGGKLVDRVRGRQAHQLQDRLPRQAAPRRCASPSRRPGSVHAQGVLRRVALRHRLEPADEQLERELEALVGVAGGEVVGERA